MLQVNVHPIMERCLMFQDLFLLSFLKKICYFIFLKRGAYKSEGTNWTIHIVLDYQYFIGLGHGNH